MRARGREEPRSTRDALVSRVVRGFHDAFGATPQHVAVAPGRVNLIGEHTDYNEGFVFPMALDKHVAVAASHRETSELRVCSVDYGELEEVPLGSLSPPGGSRWIDYVSGIVWALESEGYGVAGGDLAVAGDVPQGAGLASSAALELATARVLAAVSSLPWEPVAMARLAQRAENAFVGVACGIMDQVVSAAGCQGHALLLDCRALSFTLVPIPESVSVVVMDTGTRRALAEAAYNERRDSCERVVSLLRQGDPAVRALRDVSLEKLGSAKQSFDPRVFRRARHVVRENARTLAMSTALREADWARAGRLMNASHESLRDLYEVSSPELDLVTRLARDVPGCWGARMTGAGFGGSAIALVSRERLPAFVQAVGSRYHEETGLPGKLYPCQPVRGAHLVEVPP